jgi:hypothetical protein
MYEQNHLQMMVLQSQKVVFFFHSDKNRMATSFFNLPATIRALSQSTARMRELIRSNIQVGCVIMVFHTWKTVRNFTSSHNVLEILNGISSEMGIDSFISGKVCYNHLADANNLHDNDHIRFI